MNPETENASKIEETLPHNGGGAPDNVCACGLQQRHERPVVGNCHDHPTTFGNERTHRLQAHTIRTVQVCARVHEQNGPRSVRLHVALADPDQNSLTSDTVDSIFDLLDAPNTIDSRLGRPDTHSIASRGGIAPLA